MQGKMVNDKTHERVFVISVYAVMGSVQMVQEGNTGIHPTAVGEIPGYTGGEQAQFADLTGGVVLGETKSYFQLLNEYLSTLNE